MLNKILPYSSFDIFEKHPGAELKSEQGAGKGFLIQSLCNGL